MYLIFSLIFWLLSTECTTITGKDDLRWSGSISNGIGGESCLVSKTCELSNIYYSPKAFWKELDAVKCKSVWRFRKTLADEAGHMADLFASSQAYPETNVWRYTPEFSSSSWSSLPSSWQTPERKKRRFTSTHWCREQIQSRATAHFKGVFRSFKGFTENL